MSPVSAERLISRTAGPENVLCVSSRAAVLLFFSVFVAPFLL